MTATINNNTISQNVQDTLPVLLRLLDEEEMTKYDCMTPTALDYLADYYDGVDEMPFTIDMAQNANGTNWRPVVFNAGGHADVSPADNATYATRPTSFVSYTNNILSHDMNRPIAHTNCPKSRGSWKLKQIWAVPDTGTGVQTVPTVTDNIVYVQFEVTEPLLLSPFVFGSGMGKQGFYGIQTMNFQMNIASSANLSLIHI